MNCRLSADVADRQLGLQVGKSELQIVSWRLPILGIQINLQIGENELQLSAGLTDLQLGLQIGESELQIVSWHLPICNRDCRSADVN